MIYVIFMQIIHDSELAMFVLLTLTAFTVIRD